MIERCLRWTGEMPGTGSLAAASLQPLLDRATWAEASSFYCLMA